MDDPANPTRRTMRDAVKRELGDRIDRKVRDALLGPAKLPEGIVSLVFTDVEGSTAIVRDLGDARARPILRSHDEVVREVLGTHDGTEVERDGDGFMLAFTLASRAVGFATGLHRAIAEAFGPDSERVLRVRIGIVRRAPGG